MTTETMVVSDENYSLWAQYSGAWVIGITIPKQKQDILSEDPGDYNELLVTKEAINTGLENAMMAFRDAIEALFDGPRSVLVTKVELIQSGQKATLIT